MESDEVNAGDRHCPNCGCEETTQHDRTYPDTGYVVELECAGCGFPRGTVA